MCPESAPRRFGLHSAELAPGAAGGGSASVSGELCCRPGACTGAGTRGRIAGCRGRGVRGCVHLDRVKRLPERRVCRSVCSSAVGAEFLVLAPSLTLVGAPWEPHVVFSSGFPDFSITGERFVALAGHFGGLFCKVSAQAFLVFIGCKLHVLGLQA